MILVTEAVCSMIAIPSVPKTPFISLVSKIYFQIQAAQANRFDVVLLDHQKKRVMYIIEFLAPDKNNFARKEERSRLCPDHTVKLVILILI